MLIVNKTKWVLDVRYKSLIYSMGASDTLLCTLISFILPSVFLFYTTMKAFSICDLINNFF